LVFGQRAGGYAAQFAKQVGAGAVDTAYVEKVARAALEPFERDPKEGPYQVQQDLQEMMQNLVGIVRNEAEMKQALDALELLKQRAARVGVQGNREYNNGWHTALDLSSQLIVSEAVARAALEREESRGAHFREDRPEKSEEFGKFNIRIERGPNGEMQVIRDPVPEIPPELKQIIEEMK
jgi:succinate dehydrogenase / fumarate reductase flavoprotein subunit